MNTGARWTHPFGWGFRFPPAPDRPSGAVRSLAESDLRPGARLLVACAARQRVLNKRPWPAFTRRGRRSVARVGHRIRFFRHRPASRGNAARGQGTLVDVGIALERRGRAGKTARPTSMSIRGPDRERARSAESPRGLRPSGGGRAEDTRIVFFSRQGIAEKKRNPLPRKGGGSTRISFRPRRPGFRSPRPAGP